MTDATVPAIAGTMYVYNDKDHEIIESELTSKYKVYFPNLTIQAEHVKTANITKYIRVYDDGRIETLENRRTDGNVPLQPIEAAPTQTYYDFLGFAIDNPNTTESPRLALAYDPTSRTYSTTDVWNNLQFNEEVSVITLYAYFTRHMYVASFYDADGTTLLTQTFSGYGDKIVDPGILPSYDSKATELELTKTFKFKGYSRQVVDPLTARERDITNNLVDVATLNTTGDSTFYALYFKQSVYDEPSDLNLFDFT